MPIEYAIWKNKRGRGILVSVQQVINDVSKALESIPGIVGIVLGGSRARGTHRADSDIDIGIYPPLTSSKTPTSRLHKNRVRKVGVNC